MSNRFFFLLTFSLFTLVLSSCKKDKINLSKGFIKYFGGIEAENAGDVQQTSDGGYIIVGTTQSIGNGGSDIFLIKSDANGNQEWTKAFGNILNDEGSSVQQTSDGGYIILGTYRYVAPGVDSNKTDMYLLKTNANGDTTWTRKYGYSGTNEKGISVRQTTDGGFILAGNTDATNDGDMIVVKVGSWGALEQPMAIHPSSPTPGLDEAVNILQRADGGYVLSSYTASLTSPRAAFISNTPITSSTNAPTKNEFFEPTLQLAGEVALTNDGEYIMTGKTTSDDVFVIKFKNSVANPKIWMKTYGGGGIDLGTSIQSTPDGGYIVLGSTTSFGAGSRDLYLIKLNSAGDEEWKKTFGGAGLDVGKAVRNTSDGGYILLGTLEFGDDPSNKDNIITLIKVDGKGEITN